MFQAFGLVGEQGSSPLARGPLAILSRHDQPNGLIPARAGTTQRCRRRRCGFGAHPRSRGDHLVQVIGATFAAGSSPLARGPQADKLGIGHLYGLIPARAGTTVVARYFSQPLWAHPRSRGDHRPGINGGNRDRGSSPLARGPRFRILHVNDTCGLIPARAGTTGYRKLDRVSKRAHPRSRGDHLNCATRRAEFPGSSPLARGPRSEYSYGFTGVGLIPARAGTTPVRRGRLARRRAHPRSRGDHAGIRCRGIRYGGSSPLARGPPVCTGAGTGAGGLIPARAGTTS